MIEEETKQQRNIATSCVAARPQIQNIVHVLYAGGCDRRKKRARFWICVKKHSLRNIGNKFESTIYHRITISNSQIGRAWCTKNNLQSIFSGDKSWIHRKKNAQRKRMNNERREKHVEPAHNFVKKSKSKSKGTHSPTQDAIFMQIYFADIYSVCHGMDHFTFVVKMEDCLCDFFRRDLGGVVFFFATGR